MSTPTSPAPARANTTRLGNGLRVVTDVMAGLKTASIGVWVGAGARNETAEAHGVAHMLEHMAFKGTVRRNARMIAEEIEAVGGHLNAFTSREQTAYYARIMAADAPLAMDILADIIQRSVFDEAELARERGVVIQEIGEVEDSPDDIIFDHLLTAAYPDQTIGRPILGTIERVRGLRRSHLVSFLDSNYRAPAMTVVAAGAIEPNLIADLAAKHFENLPNSGESNCPPARYQGGEYREARDLEQAHVALALPAVAFDHPDYYAVQVYATLLGGGMSSRLFQEIREKRGLAYTVSASAAAFRDAGLLLIYAGTSPESLDELLPVIGDEMHKTTQGIGTDEIERARAQLTAGLMMSLESSSSRIEQLARQTLALGRTLDADELIGKINAVDGEQLRRIAAEMLRQPPAVAVLGPIGQLDKSASLAAKCGMIASLQPAAAC